MALVQWAEWDPQSGEGPQGIRLVEFPPLNIVPEAGPSASGPYLHATRVPGWNAIIAAHSKAVDEHVKLYGNLSKATSLHSLQVLHWSSSTFCVWPFQLPF